MADQVEPNAGGQSAFTVVTVLLVDSPRSVRKALRERLSLERGLEIIGEAEDATHAVGRACALGPDVVLVDAEAADLDAPMLVRRLAEHDAHIGVVVLTQRTVAAREDLEGTRAIVVDKQAGLAALVMAIRSAAVESHCG